MTSTEPPRWWQEPCGLPEWVDDLLSPAQLNLPNSMKWTLCVRANTSMTATERHVGLTVATFMDPTKCEAWPSMATLAQVTGRKRDTCRIALRALARNGWLEIRHTAGSRGTSSWGKNRYFGLFPDDGVRVDPTGPTTTLEQPGWTYF